MFYKQRDMRLYPAWAYTLPTTFLRVFYSATEAGVWSLIVYWTVGFAPEFGRCARAARLARGSLAGRGGAARQPRQPAAAGPPRELRAVTPFPGGAARRPRCAMQQAAGPPLFCGGAREPRSGSGREQGAGAAADS